MVWFQLFQSPYGDYLVRNKGSEGWKLTTHVFQSPYGDYLVINDTIILEECISAKVSVPLRGLLS